MPSPEAEGADDADHIIDAFWRLSNLRTNGMNGPDPIQPGAIREWCNLTGNRLDRREIEIILEMDAAFMATVSAVQRETQTREAE